MKKGLALAAFLLGSALCSSCDKDSGSGSVKPILIDTDSRFEHSNIAGNLMATAIRADKNLDIVFYPSSFLMPGKFAIIDTDLTEDVIKNRILPLYTTNPRQDLFQVGTLKGSDIREFVLNRTLENYRLDVHTAGLEYEVQFLGGLPTIYQINLNHGVPLEDDKYYRVAISDNVYSTFPGYRYRNNLEQIFIPEPEKISASKALTNYLSAYKRLPVLDDTRASVRTRDRGELPGLYSIPQLQGKAHLSPYYGYRVTTRGIITVVGKVEDGIGMEMYIQGPDDGDPKTSNAINVYLANVRPDLAPGQEIEVHGLISETMTNQGMTRTSIREVDNLRVISQGNPLPEPVIIGAGGINPPNRYISTYRGNLNQKDELNLADGIDFWESLEGMRLRVTTPTVVGHRGGKDTYEDVKSNYITVYVTPEGASDPANITDAGGLMAGVDTEDYNPEVVRIVDSVLAPNVKPSYVFNTGDKFPYDLEGVLSYQTNSFGDGEFVLFVTGQFSALSTLKSLEERPKTSLESTENQLTVAAYNVENLGGNQKKRLKEVGRSISINLKCPDILVVPEIQDFNGPNYDGGASAKETLQGVLDNLDCVDAESYRALNIDPVPMQDGGEPGGNIRVAMIFNSKRVGFVPRGNALALDETTVEEDGSLNQNPGRVLPNDTTFRRSRKPLVAEFTFRGQKVFVIGNHLNSKLGDGNRWGVEQPLPYSSEVQRSLIGKRLNQFVTRLQLKNPTANIIVAGDMNAYWSEPSMKILSGKVLTNLMTYKNIFPSNSWYTSNYDGSAAAIDQMFASRPLLDKNPEFEVVHFNSNFMNKVSDHDPVIGRFTFP